MSKPKRKILIIGEGEYICSRCNGSSFRSKFDCPLCGHAGKLDWLSRIIKPRIKQKNKVYKSDRPILRRFKYVRRSDRCWYPVDGRSLAFLTHNSHRKRKRMIYEIKRRIRNQ